MMTGYVEQKSVLQFRTGFCEHRHANKKNVKWSRYAGVLCERRYSCYSFLTSALEGGEWLASRPGHALPPEERAPGTHCIGGWVGLRAGLHVEANGKFFCLCRGSNPGCLGRGQTLY
jgi:hypothetical protein